MEPPALWSIWDTSTVELVISQNGRIDRPRQQKYTPLMSMLHDSPSTNCRVAELTQHS